MTVTPDTIALLFQRMSEVVDSEWYQALVMRFMDEADNLADAIELADRAITTQPTPLEIA